MQKIATLFIILGLLAVALGFFDYAPRIIAWIYQWGENTAWIIKIGLIAAGGLLYLATEKKQRAKG